MLTRLLHNKSAAQRILKDLAKKVVEIKEVKRSIFVKYQTHSGKIGCTFVARQKFLDEFNRYRNDAAQGCKVVVHSLREQALVSDPQSKSKDVHFATLETCTCADHKFQIEAWGKAQCKHQRALAFALGYSSVNAAIAANDKNRKVA